MCLFQALKDAYTESLMFLTTLEITTYIYKHKLKTVEELKLFQWTAAVSHFDEGNCNYPRPVVHCDIENETIYEFLGFLEKDFGKPFFSLI